MKFVSIDLETTGLDESFCQILEFGAIAWEIGKGQIGQSFVRRFIYDKIVGQPIGLAMNAKIIREIEERNPAFSKSYIDNNDASYSGIALFTQLMHWLKDNVGYQYGVSRVTVAGKNFGSFDSKFLIHLDHGRKWMSDLFHHRYLDPGNLYFDPKIDNEIPSTSVCMKRAGLNPELYELHTTLGDCRLVCDLIEYYYSGERKR